MMVNGMPASFNRMPARRPDCPQPMTTTGKAARAAGSECTPVRRASVPSNSISSISMGTYSAGTSSHTNHSIISWSSSAETGAGSGQPRSRYSRMTRTAMDRTSSLSSSLM